MDKIDYLHSKTGSFEWSGELITREEGTIVDLDKWKITAEDVYLADIGSSGYTEYNAGRGGFKSSDIIELYDKFPELEEGKLKLQHIHSHHNMSTFFSGTDWENLNDRALVSNYFLMLIVNFDGKYCAKVAYRANRKGGGKTILEFANNSDGYNSLILGQDRDDEVLVVMDCKIMIEERNNVPADFVARYEAVKKAIKDEQDKEAEERKNRLNTNPPYLGRELPFGQGLWDSEKEENKYKSHSSWEQDINGGWSRKNNKRVFEMTEKEWKESEEREAAEMVFRIDQQSNIKFEEKHARAFMNSILDSSYRMDNYKDVREPLIQENKKLKHQEAIEAWSDSWQDMLQEHFDVIFPQATIAQYSELLGAIYSYLKQYKYIRLVKEMLDCLENEIEMTTENPKIPNS